MADRAALSEQAGGRGRGGAGERGASGHGGAGERSGRGVRVCSGAGERGGRGCGGTGEREQAGGRGRGGAGERGGQSMPWTPVVSSHRHFHRFLLPRSKGRRGTLQEKRFLARTLSFFGDFLVQFLHTWSHLQCRSKPAIKCRWDCP